MHGLRCDRRLPIVLTKPSTMLKCGRSWSGIEHRGAGNRGKCGSASRALARLQARCSGCRASKTLPARRSLHLPVKALALHDAWLINQPKSASRAGHDLSKAASSIRRPASENLIELYQTTCATT